MNPLSTEPLDERQSLYLRLRWDYPPFRWFLSLLHNMVLRSDEFSALPVVWALFTVFTLTGLYLWQNKVAIDAGKRLPPGPPRLPLIGSLLQMPKDTQWHTFEQWRKEHSEL